MAYDTASDIIAVACAELGLQSVVDPYASLAAEQIQLRNLLNQCGRELVGAHQWQQLVKTHSFSTTASPPSDGKYALPSDFLYLINQTGWNSTNALPLGGPLTRQQYAYLVGSGLDAMTIYVAFNINQGEIELLPAPAPASQTITFHYMSNSWVDVLGAGTSFATKATDADDEIMFEPILISKMLVTRYKTSKGLPAQASMQEFQNMYALYTGLNQPAPILSLSVSYDYPYLNPWSNLPPTNFGS